MSKVTRMNTKDRANQKASSVVAMIKIAQHYARIEAEKVCIYCKTSLTLTVLIYAFRIPELLHPHH